MATIKKGRVNFEGKACEAAFGYIKGTCKWAELLEIGMYGTYGIKMYGDEVAELETELSAMQDAAFAEVEELGKPATKAELFKVDEDGEKYLNFKLKENKADGTPNKVTMLDAGGNVVADWDKLVGNGSTVKIKYRIAPYYMSSTKMVGISYNFYAVQVINLQEFKKKDSGFGDETSDGGPISAADVEANEDF